MVWARNIAAALFVFSSLHMASAQAYDRASVEKFYIEMKLTAKTLRIAAQLGRTYEFPTLKREAYNAAVTAGTWPMDAVPNDIAVTCRHAANSLLDAAKAAEKGDAPEYEKRMDSYRAWEDWCFKAYAPKR